MGQRLGVASALLGDPQTVVLDEPVNGLDPEGIADMRKLLRELPQRTGATVLLSSHLLSEIEQVASHVGILSGGRLVLQGELKQLMSGLAAEIVIEADDLDNAAAIATAHGFVVEQTPERLIVSLAVGDNPRTAAAALTSTLCAAGVSIFAITPCAHSLETLYHRSAQTLPA
jgi:ABC-2 type transport system ATP-binding protein